MKKLFLTAFVASMFIFASCSNAIDKKLDRLEELKEQSLKLDETGASATEYTDIFSEVMDIMKELDGMKKDMTKEQEERLNEIINN